MARVISALLRHLGIKRDLPEPILTMGHIAIMAPSYGLPSDFGIRYDAIPRSYSERSWDDLRDRYDTFDRGGGTTYPHCDARVLHRPGKCAYCDLYPSRQVERLAMTIRFSGESEPADWAECPADHAVAVGARGDYNRWPGNTPGGYEDAGWFDSLNR